MDMHQEALEMSTQGLADILNIDKDINAFFNKNVDSLPEDGSNILLESELNSQNTFELFDSSEFVEINPVNQGLLYLDIYSQDFFDKDPLSASDGDYGGHDIKGL